MGEILRNLSKSLLFQFAEHYRETRWRPLVDIYRCGHGWLVKFDLAGVRPEDINLTVQSGHLHVAGVRRDLSIPEGRSWSMEIPYNRFERSIELPCDFERVAIDSEFRDGMLLVTIRTEQER
jgi:HSP20 family protein